MEKKVPTLLKFSFDRLKDASARDCLEALATHMERDLLGAILTVTGKPWDCQPKVTQK